MKKIISVNIKSFILLSVLKKVAWMLRDLVEGIKYHNSKDNSSQLLKYAFENGPTHV